MSEGTFNISNTIYIKTDCVTLEGLGTGARTGSSQAAGVGTKLLYVGTGANIPILQVQQGTNTRPLYAIVLRDFLLDGNGDRVDPPAGVTGIYYRSNRGLIDHVHVTRCTKYGINTQGYASPLWNLYDTMIAFCQVERCLDHNLFLDLQSTDMQILNCVIHEAGFREPPSTLLLADNLHMLGGSAQICNCHFWGAGRYNIYFNKHGSRTKLSNCKIEGAQQHGVVVEAGSGGSTLSDLQFTGCNFKNSGLGGDNQYDHLFLTGDSSQSASRTVIVGNAFTTDGVSNKARYGVNLSNNFVLGAAVLGNSFGPDTHFGTKQVNIASTATPLPIVRDNVNFVTENRSTNLTQAKIAGANTFADVTHGVSYTPQAGDITVTPVSDQGFATKYWVSNITSTQFRVNVSPAPGVGTTATFDWSVRRTV